jgi:glycosyltransferase involved in cell wall biosynthesis
MDKKKVIILGKLPPPYIGPAIATRIILDSDLRNRFELIHLNTKINEELSAFGRIRFGKILKNLGLYRRLIRLIKAHRPDLILVPVSQTKIGFLKDAVFISIAHRFGVKVLIHLRGSEFRSWYESEGQATKNKIRKTLGKCSGAIVLGNKLKPIFSDFFTDERIFVVPNGGNYIFPQRKESEKVKILFFSNLMAAKGVLDLLQAVKILQQKNITGFECDFVGDWYRPEDKKAFENILSGSKLPVKVHRPVGGETKLQYFANADIFVFPPNRPEGHPWAIVEALAAGLPVISTDQGAITESVINGENGFIVEAGAPGQISEKLELLIADKNLRKEMGIHSRKIYIERFTEEKMVDNLTTVFNLVMNGTDKVDIDVAEEGMLRRICNPAV